MPSGKTAHPFMMVCDALDHASDYSLLEGLRRGNDAAAKQFYDRYAQRLLSLTEKNTGKDLSIRFDAEDVIQSVFRSFFERARNGLYDVPDDGDIWPLLLVIALHKIRAYGARHRAARRDVGREHYFDAGAEVGRAIQRQLSNESQPLLNLIVEETLEQLPSLHRQATRLRLEGYCHLEIAQMTGRSKRTIERIFQECRQLLQLHFELASRTDAPDLS